jgi:hypothetical protein
VLGLAKSSTQPTPALLRPAPMMTTKIMLLNRSSLLRLDRQLNVQGLARIH